MTVRPPGSGLKSIGGHSLIYGLGTLAIKLLGFVFIPVFTHYLSPSDYGILGLAAATSLALTTLMSLNLHGVTSYFYFKARNVTDKRERLGTIWTAMVAYAACLALLLELLGQHVFGLVAGEVPYNPYLRLVLWTTFLNVFGLMPMALLQAGREPWRYVGMSLFTAVSFYGLIYWQVVGLAGGAYGYLVAGLIAAAMMLLPNLVITLRRLKPALRATHLKNALVYCLPLIPHGMGAWLLEVSDRLILERYVTLDQVGIYTLGYQLATILYLVAAAVNNAASPHIFEHVQANNAESRSSLRVATTYYAAAFVWIALAFLLLLDPLVHWFIAPSYHLAIVILPWLVLGMLCHAFYFIPANILFATGRTAGIAMMTITAGVVNVIANLILVPRFGMPAAAWSTLLGYAVLLGFVWRKAAFIFPVDYDYHRIIKVGVAGLVLYVFSALAWGLSDAARLTVGLLLLVLYLPSLYVLRFFSEEEITHLKSWWRTHRFGESG